MFLFPVSTRNEGDAQLFTWIWQASLPPHCDGGPFDTSFPSTPATRPSNPAVTCRWARQPSLRRRPGRRRFDGPSRGRRRTGRTPRRGRSCSTRTSGRPASTLRSRTFDTSSSSLTSKNFCSNMPSFTLYNIRIYIAPWWWKLVHDDQETPIIDLMTWGVLVFGI